MQPSIYEGEKHFFDLREVGPTLPETAESILKDLRLVNQPECSCRLIRIYRELPLHFHRESSENVYVVHGEATFQLGEDTEDISAGMFVHFPKNAVHGILRITEHPLIVLTIDTPCRPESDVTFLNPAEADKEDFNGKS